jgi:hypothetical protein
LLKKCRRRTVERENGVNLASLGTAENDGGDDDDAKGNNKKFMFVVFSSKLLRSVHVPQKKKLKKSTVFCHQSGNGSTRGNPSYEERKIAKRRICNKI